MSRQENGGFTLIEVLVAITIFSILATFAYATLAQTLLNSEMLGERMDRLQAVQKAVRTLTMDFQQLAPRPVRTDFGDTLSPALASDSTSGNLLELTHSGWSNPAQLARSTLQRSAYRLDGQELIRYYWPVLDRTMNNEVFEVKLLDNVDSIAIRYLKTDGEWIDHWPPREMEPQQAVRLRPRAAEIVLTLNDFGEIRRLIEIAP